MTATVQFDTGYHIDARYTIEKILGTGSFGTVYLCDDMELGRAVAVKVLHKLSLLAVGDETRQRFFREARALSQLKHKYIVNVHRIGVLDSGQAFLVMEYVSGKSLTQEVAAKGSLAFNEAMRRALQIAEALHHAHSEGIIHRDVKPDNVLVVESGGQDSIRLLDFGLSALVQQSDQGPSQLTRTGSIIGTPMYVSPEVFRGHAADARSDIYSLGCVIFEMIAGHPPFQSDDIAEAMMHHLNQQLPDLKQLDQEAKLPSALQLFLNKATAKERESRYANMQEVIDELRSLLQINSEAKFNPSKFRQMPGNSAVSAGNRIRPFSHAVVCILIAVAVSVLAAVWFAFVNPQQFTSIAGSLLPPGAMVRLLPHASWLIQQVAGLSSAEAFAAHTLRAPVIRSWSPQDRLTLACSYGRQFQSDRNAASLWPFLTEILQDSLECVRMGLPPASAQDDATVGDALQFLRYTQLTENQWLALTRLLDANYHSVANMQHVWHRSINAERVSRLYADASEHEGQYRGQLAERAERQCERLMSEARAHEYDRDPQGFLDAFWVALKFAQQCKLDSQIVVARQMQAKFDIRRRQWKNAWDDLHELDAMDRKAFTEESWAEHEQIKEQLRPYASRFSQ